MKQVVEFINNQLIELNKIEEFLKKRTNGILDNPIKLESTIISLINNHKKIYKTQNNMKNQLQELGKRVNFLKQVKDINKKRKRESELKNNNNLFDNTEISKNHDENEKIIINNIIQSNEITELEILQSNINNFLQIKLMVS